MAQKEAAVVIVDVGPTMWRKPRGGGGGGGGNGSGNETHLEKAQLAVNQILHSKIVGGRKTDLIGVLLVGSDMTDNPLALQSGGYERIKVQAKIGMVSLELLKYISEECEKGTSHGDVIDGVVVAIDMLETHCKKLKWAKQIFLFTDAAATIDFDQIDAIEQKATDYGVKLSIIGFGFTEEGPPETDQSLRSNNERRLREFANATGGDVFQGDEALALLLSLRSRSVRPTTLIRHDLVLGSSEGGADSPAFRVRVFAYAKVKEAKVPSAKKFSRVAADAADVDEPEKVGEVAMSRGYKVVQQAIEEGGDGETKLADDVELAQDDLVKAYKYGKDLVPFSEEDKEAMRLPSEKGFYILGFIKKHEVPREYYLNDPMQIIADPDSPHAKLRFEVFTLALHTKNMAALVRYVRIDNASPKLGIILPHVGRKIWCAWIHIPFKEDIRDFSFPALTPLLADGTDSVSFAFTPSIASQTASAAPSSQIASTIMSTAGKALAKNPPMAAAKRRKLDVRKVASEEADRRIDAFIESMDLMTAIDDDGEKKEAYKPTDVFNPGYQRFYQCIAHRAMNPDDKELPPIDPRFMAGVLPMPELEERTRPKLDLIREAFTITKVERDKISNKERFKRNLNAAAKIEQDLEEAAVAAGMGVDNNDVELTSISGMTDRLISSVGTADPVGDFKAMVGRRDTDLVPTAIDQMTAIIVRLVETSFGAQFFRKAMQCLQALREACVVHSESAKFNAWLRDVVRAKALSADGAGAGGGGGGGGFRGFWGLMKEEGPATTGLITTDEAGESSVSADDAAKFFEEEEVAAPPAPVAVEEVDDDQDMLEMLD